MTLILKSYEIDTISWIPKMLYTEMLIWLQWICLCILGILKLNCKLAFLMFNVKCDLDNYVNKNVFELLKNANEWLLSMISTCSYAIFSYLGKSELLVGKTGGHVPSHLEGWGTQYQMSPPHTHLFLFILHICVYILQIYKTSTSKLIWLGRILKRCLKLITD